MTTEPGRNIARPAPESAIASRELVHVAEGADDIEFCFEQGWTDGLPVVPPTIERVNAMLRDNGLQGDELVALLPPFERPVRASAMAANAVMAGALPEHMPFILAALQAVCEPQFNLPMVTATTGGLAITLLVSGPEDDLDGKHFHWKEGVLGPSRRGNLVVSRALYLILRNFLELSERDRATVGNPGRVAITVVEAPTPGWIPLRQVLGFDPNLTTVTAISTEGPHQVANHFSHDPEVILSAAADVMASCHMMTGAFAVVLCPEHTRLLMEAGWDHYRARSFLAQRAKRSARHLKEWGRAAGRVFPDDDQIFKRAAAFDEDVLIVPAGGAAGGFSAIIPCGGIDTLISFKQTDPELKQPDDVVARASSLPATKAVGACVDCI